MFLKTQNVPLDSYNAVLPIRTKISRRKSESFSLKVYKT